MYAALCILTYHFFSYITQVRSQWFQRRTSNRRPVLQGQRHAVRCRGGHQHQSDQSERRRYTDELTSMIQRRRLTWLWLKGNGLEELKRSHPNVAESPGQVISVGFVRQSLRVEK